MNKYLTVSENNAALDSSEFTYRRPWYSGAYQSLITAEQASPYGHGNTEPLYSNRVIGQKKYELTNHLGNVMAVVSDKVTEVADSNGALSKRAALSAAYDYYPFGMQMPGRVVEDGGVHCVPVSRTWFVNETVPDGSSSSGGSSSLLKSVTPVGEGLTAHHEDQAEGLPESITISLPDSVKGRPIGMEMALPALGTNETGMNLIFHVTGSNGSDEAEPDIVSLLQRKIGDDEWETVSAGKVNGSGTIHLVADALNANDQMKVSTTVTGKQLGLTDLGYSRIVKATKTYIALSCDTDGVFDGTYRFGFNGQMKVNEIAGTGNHNSALFWEYDTRMGRRWNLDPKPNIPESQYSVMGDNPIWRNDILGDKWANLHEESRNKAMTKKR